MPRDDDLFAEALELPPEAQEAFLDRMCGDDAALRSRVSALLRAYSEAANFLEQAPVVAGTAGVAEKPGDTIDRYVLEEKIGEGGCGIVYRAEQREPVRRRVALKIIKLGMDTRSVIARFEAERQVLALMEHPGIARVFDAGATDSGRPYFVMELVDGVPLTRFCDERGLVLPARLELFVRVCLAVQHAHQKGIIHRDLKPSNILVAQHDGAPAPKIIDFGIAKATQGGVTDETVVTVVGQFVGTPAYMSPEQIGGPGDDIDTRSDIYALGVLLYELLAGRLPFEAGTLRTAGVDELRRIIRELDPPRPSARFTKLPAANREAVARMRGVLPDELAAELRGDLDWIVVRCLEKDRARRYATAVELADDVRRHLRDEPVLARPPELAYRAGKFVARNRLACASAAAVASALLIGTAVSVRQAVRATQAERIARAERDTATAAQQAEALARDDAQRRQEQAEDLVAFMLGDFRAELTKLGRLELLDAVGEKALAYFDSLDARDLTDTALARQAKAITQIGEVRMEQARYVEAERAFATAYERAAALAARHPENGDMLFERAQAEYWRGFVHWRRGEFASAAEWLARYRDSALALVTVEGPTVRARSEIAYGHHNLAVMNTERGDLPAARAGFLAEIDALQALISVRPENLQLRLDLADAHSWLGKIAEREGALMEAAAQFAAQAGMIGELADREPGNPRWQFWLANAWGLQAGVLAITGHPDQAAALAERADALFDMLVARDPKNRNWQLTALNVKLQLAQLRLAAGAAADVADLLRATREKLEALVAAEPTSRAYAARLASAWRLEAQRRLAAGKDDAKSAVERAREISEALLREERADVRMVGEFAETCVLAGDIAAARGARNAAAGHWERVIALLTDRETRSDDWRLLDPLARALERLGRAGESRALVGRLHTFGYRPLTGWAANSGQGPVAETQ